jgi:hypothetical protein
MKKIIRLTESDLTRIVRRVISEQQVEANAGSIQEFLKANQDNTIAVDYKFGNKTATAVAKYIVRGYNDASYNNVTTVNQLWQVMKDDGHNVGAKPGFGPMMAAEVARLLIQAKAKLDAWYASKNKK